MPIYMWYQGIDGPVKRKGKNWILLDSAQLGVNQSAGSGNGRGTSREAAQPTSSEITIAKALDVASSALFRQSLSGSGKKVIIEFVRTDRNGAEEAAYMTIELENTLIGSFSTAGSGGARGAPTETLTLNFSKMTFSDAAPGKLSESPERVNRSQWYLDSARY